MISPMPDSDTQYEDHSTDSESSSVELSDDEDSGNLSKWKHLDSENIGEFYFDSSSVDDHLLQTALIEAHGICANYRRILRKNVDDKVMLSEVTNYFLGAIIPSMLSVTSL
jgi:hypothetical protein